MQAETSRQTQWSESIGAKALVFSVGIIGAIVLAFSHVEKLPGAGSDFDPSERDVPSVNDPTKVYRTLYFSFETNIVEKCYIHKLKLYRVNVPIIRGYPDAVDPLKRAPFGRLAFYGGHVIYSQGVIEYVNINRCDRCVQIMESVRGFTREEIAKFEVGKKRGGVIVDVERPSLQ